MINKLLLIHSALNPDHPRKVVRRRHPMLSTCYTDGKGTTTKGFSEKGSGCSQHCNATPVLEAKIRSQVAASARGVHYSYHLADEGE